jgi:hypothetical protein
VPPFNICFSAPQPSLAGFNVGSDCSTIASALAGFARPFPLGGSCSTSPPSFAPPVGSANPMFYYCFPFVSEWE